MFIEIPGSFRVVEALPADEKHVKQTLAEADAAAYPGYQCYVILEKKYFRYLIVNENDLIRQEVAYIDTANLATVAQLAAKADAATVTAALAEKSNITHHHNGVYATIESVAAKADAATVNAALDTKANSTDVINALAQKLNTADAASTYATKQEVSVITGTDPELVVTPEDIANLQSQINQKSDSSHNHDADYAAANHSHNGTYVDLSTYNNDLNQLNESKSDVSHLHDTRYRRTAIPIEFDNLNEEIKNTYLPDRFEKNYLRYMIYGKGEQGEVIPSIFTLDHTTPGTTINVWAEQNINITLLQNPVSVLKTLQIPSVISGLTVFAIPKGYVLSINLSFQSTGWPYTLRVKAHRRSDPVDTYNQTLISLDHSAGTSYTRNNKYLFMWDGNEWRQLLQ